MPDDNSSEKIKKRFKELNQDAKKNGYYLNPDESFTMGLVEGLLKNAERYGYESCPCRLSFGEKKHDLDIICPCDYRDDDISEYGACFCGLYLSKTNVEKKITAPVIPDRRPSLKDRLTEKNNSSISNNLSYPVYRCKVCGYLCARNNPPDKCPICKADRERFEIFIR
ncbi:MAG: ferredoxin:glutaredoxin reductase [Methanomicrobiales archaeon]|nr:ferredoxin:glutaredoxin reductase [Methanomicrobiales archaeon]